MKIFLVYSKNEGISDIKIVKTGFAFFPAVLNIIWATYHKIWFIVFPILFIHSFLALTGHNDAADIFQFSQVALFLLFSEEMQIWNLEHKGYKLAEVVYANSEDEANYKYLQNNHKNEQ